MILLDTHAWKRTSTYDDELMFVWNKKPESVIS